MVIVLITLLIRNRVHAQRQSYHNTRGKSGDITKERKKALDDIGFVWTVSSKK